MYFMVRDKTGKVLDGTHILHIYNTDSTGRSIQIPQSIGTGKQYAGRGTQITRGGAHVPYNEGQNLMITLCGLAVLCPCRCATFFPVSCPSSVCDSFPVLCHSSV